MATCEDSAAQRGAWPSAVLLEQCDVHECPYAEQALLLQHCAEYEEQRRGRGK